MPGWAASIEILHRSSYHICKMEEVSQVVLMIARSASLLSEAKHTRTLCEHISLAATARKLILICVQNKRQLGQDMRTVPGLDQHRREGDMQLH